MKRMKRPGAWNFKLAVLVCIAVFWNGSGCATGKWGYIQPDDTMAIPPHFEDATPFIEGLAAVKVGEKWGYIDKTGKTVIEPQFQGAWVLRDGLASVVDDDERPDPGVLPDGFGQDLRRDQVRPGLDVERWMDTGWEVVFRMATSRRSEAVVRSRQ